MRGVDTEILEIKLAGGWRGLAVVRAGSSGQFSKSGWEKLLAWPEKLLEESQQTLNSNGNNMVKIRNLNVDGVDVKAVLKQRRRRWGIREAFRSLGEAQAIRNFATAIRMKQYGLPVAAPLAAVYHRIFFLCDRSIYISEYVNGTNLYDFLRNMQKNGIERYRIMQELSEQMSDIFANLHKNNLWHRDAKASNFVVSRNSDGENRITITDVDGIKPYISRSAERQMQGLWQLAASVIALPGITRTDYLRTFEKYCDKVGIDSEEREGIFRRLVRKTQAKYHLKQAKQGR